MNLTGIPVSRWIDGVLEDPENMDQPQQGAGHGVWGHAPNSQTRMKEMKRRWKSWICWSWLILIQPSRDHA